VIEMGHEDSPIYRIPGEGLYRCSNGHEWKAAWGRGKPIKLDFGIEVSINNLCPYCLEARARDLIRNVGRAERVEGGDADAMASENERIGI